MFTLNGERYFSVKEAAEQLGVPVHSLRYWTKKGYYHPARHPISNSRLFTPEDIKALQAKLREGQESLE